MLPSSFCFDMFWQFFHNLWIYMCFFKENHIYWISCLMGDMNIKSFCQNFSNSVIYCFILSSWNTSQESFCDYNVWYCMIWFFIFFNSFQNYASIKCLMVTLESFNPYKSPPGQIYHNKLVLGMTECVFQKQKLKAIHTCQNLKGLDGSR